MAVTTELKKDKALYQTKLNISRAEIENSISKELLNLAKKVKMPGFRAGKVPMKMVQDKYQASVQSDIVNNKINEAIRNVIKNNKLDVVGEPKIKDFKNEQNSDIEFILEVELMPEVQLPDFKKFELEKPVLIIDAKDVDSELTKLANSSKDFKKEVKTGAKIGDQVTLDAVGYVDGKAFEGGKLDSHKLVLGSKTFIDNFEDQLLGSKTGNELSVNVTFPKAYHAKDLAGKPAEFKVKVLSVHKAENSKIDDEFAKKFKFDNLEALKEQISKNVGASFNESINTMMKMHLFDLLEKELQFDAPSSMIDKEYQILKNQANNAGELDEALKAMSEDEINKYFYKIANRRVKIGLMLAEYVKIKGLKIDQNDIKNAVLAQARNYPGQEHQVIEFYNKNPEAIKNLQGPIIEDKAVQNIFSYELTINEKQYDQQALEALLERENNKIFG